MLIHEQNWSGHMPFHAAHFHQPETIAALQEIVRHAEKVRVFGGRHSFNEIADTTDTLLSLANLEEAIQIDHERQIVTIPGGMTYSELCPQLDAAGYALHNMASLDHITVVGACMTATHGSGDTHGNLSTAVSALEIVTASGDLVTLSRENDGDTFLGSVVSLGALGVVTRLTLDLVPSFTVQQSVYKDLSMVQVYEHFDEIMSTGYSVSLFPTWQQDAVDTLWIKEKLQNANGAVGASTFFGATLKPNDSAIASLSPDRPPDRTLTETGVPGKWYQRLPHFRLFDVDAVGDELQSEYFVARQHAVEAIKRVAEFRDEVAPILSVSEIRTIAADKLWLSSAYGQETVGLHFNWFKRWGAIKPFLPILEEALAPFSPRPHWGKLFTMSPEQVQAAYPRMTDFRALVQEYDPQGKFRNAFVDRYIFG